MADRPGSDAHLTGIVINQAAAQSAVAYRLIGHHDDMAGVGEEAGFRTFEVSLVTNQANTVIGNRVDIVHLSVTKLTHDDNLKMSVRARQERGEEAYLSVESGTLDVNKTGGQGANFADDLVELLADNGEQLVGVGKLFVGSVLTLVDDGETLGDTGEIGGSSEQLEVLPKRSKVGAKEGEVPTGSQSWTSRQHSDPADSGPAQKGATAGAGAEPEPEASGWTRGATKRQRRDDGIRRLGSDDRSHRRSRNDT